MSKLAPKRKRPKRVAKKIDRRFGLAHYDKKAIYIRKVARAIDSMRSLATDNTLAKIWDESIFPRIFEENVLVPGLACEVERGPLHTPTAGMMKFKIKAGKI